MDDQVVLTFLRKSLGGHIYANSSTADPPSQLEVRSQKQTQQSAQDEISNVTEDSEYNTSFSKILCIYTESGQCAGLNYDYANHLLEIIEPFSFSSSARVVLESLLLQIQPDVLVCNNKVKSILRYDTSEQHEDNESSYKIETKSTKEFQQSEGQLFFKSLVAEVIGKGTNPKMLNLLKELLNSADYSFYASAMCAMSPYIERILLNVQGNEKIDIIYEIKFIPLKDTMIIDEDTLQSLKIIEPYSPNRKVNSPTLYSMLKKTCSKIGADTLKSFILRPLCNIVLINERLNTVQNVLNEIERSGNDSSIGRITEGLKSIGNVQHTIGQLKLGNMKSITWRQLRSFFIHSTRIYKAIDGSENLKNSKVFMSYMKSLEFNVVTELQSLLESILDFSTDPNHITILGGVYPELDKYRKTYNEMETILQRVSIEISRKISREVNTAYIPQLGYLVVIEISDLSDAIDLDDEWNEVFRTSTTLYFKNKTMEDMDDHYGDIYSLIRDSEIEVLYALKERILAHGEGFVQSYNLLGEIDVMINFGHISHNFDYRKPEMAEQSLIDLLNCHHPLYHDNYIANDIKLTEEKIMVLTGPNFSGKSSILVQIGLITYLSHIGCFIPGSGRIGVTDRILTRINTRESVSKMQSTFMTDCQQMSKCLNRSSSKSLILIDEFGKGTDIIDGPALLASTIKNLSQRGSNAPLTLLATHFIELFKDNVVEFPNPIKLAQMKIVINDRTTKNITYLYKLEDGLSTGSFGVYCAKACGIQDDVIQKAELVIELLNNGQDLVEKFSEINSDQILAITKAEKVVKAVLAMDLDTMDDQMLVKNELLTLLRATN